MSKITFQINICPGDIAYAHLTVPPLVEMYRSACAEVLAVVDYCPPQATQFVNAAKRFPAAEFNRRVTALEQMVTEWQQANLFDRVIELRPDSDRFQVLSQKYLQGIVQETHDGFGHALMSYLTALEEPETDYVLHFDSDILMYSEPGTHWLEEAVEQLQNRGDLLAVSPRITPPHPQVNAPSEATPAIPNHPESGWLSTWQVQKVEGGWLSDWISNRCFLLDRQRLQKMGHLIPDHAFHRSRRHARIHHWARQWANSRWLGSLGDLSQLQPGDGFTLRLQNAIKHHLLPVYPQPPEVMLHERMREQRLKCLYLSRGDTWYVHPTTKPPEFIALLPPIVEAISAGDYPIEQVNFSEIRLAYWANYLKASNIRSTQILK